MKVKEVQIGDTKFKIASLTVDQYEVHIGNGVDVKGKEFIKAHMVPVVAASMRNAQAGSGKWFPNWDGEADAVTPQKVSSELDFGELQSLYGEVIELSGLKASAPKPGEVAAATIQ